MNLVNYCYLCKKDAESCNHVFLWCSIVYKLSFVVYGLLGISWMMRVQLEMNYGHGRHLWAEEICGLYPTYHLLGNSEGEK